MTNHETPWPTLGDRAFMARFDYEDIDLQWLRHYAKDDHLAEGFRLMADLAVGGEESRVVRSPERLSSPSRTPTATQSSSRSRR